MGLQPEFTPNALKSSFYSPEELAEVSMANEAQRLEERGVIGRGLTRGMYQTGSLLNNALGGLTEPFAPQYSQTAFNDALGYDQLAQQQIAPSDVLSYDKVDGLGSAARYIGGAFAENLPNALLTIPAGLGAGVALRGSALSPMARIVAGSMAGAAPLQFGEGIQTMRQDPNILATTTPTERLGYGAGYAALTAPMEGLGEGMLAARAAGAGSKALKNVFKDGLSATLKDSAAHVAKAVPESLLTEGATEALQQATQQGLKTHLNPERDKSKDEHELIDSFLKGWAAGAPTSIVGRGADAAWAQGRGATDAVKGLLRDKMLPDHLKDRPDNELLDWDNADNEQRNSWASQLADSIMSGDAPQTLKDSAAKFYERMQSGAKDAWTSLSEPLMEDERVGRARAGVERFINAAKKANENTFGKANAEASEFDQDLYQQFGEYLDPKGASARDTELKSNLFNTVKQALIDDDWADLPITELEDEFGTIGRATAAITKLRENMVRAGMVEHDDEFGKLLEATALDGQRGDRAKMDVIARYGRSYIKGKPKDAELKAVSRGLTDILSKWSSLSDTHKAAFEKRMKKEFGANAEKVIEAHKPKTIADTEIDLSEDSGNSEISAPKQRFIGQATQQSRKVASGGQQQNTIEDHGGFFRLDHPDEETRASIKRGFNDAQADLRKDGYFVKPMSPLEYHEATGISKSTIRRHLGYKTIAELETSNAKILAVEPRSEDALSYDKDNTSLDHDDIKALSERTERSLSTIPESFPIEDKVLLGKISKALKQGKGSRTAMRELGFEHGVKLRPAGGKVYLHNNTRHGGNGVFTVHMKDGTKYDISAQHLISQMRERGKGTLTDRSAYRMFLSGIAAIQNNENVEKITANNLWGETDEHPFAMAPGVTNHFQLEKGLNLSWAHKRSQAYEKSLNQPTNLDAAVEELDDVNEQLAEDPENEELLERQAELEEAVAQLQAEQDQYEGEGERHEPGEVRTSDDMTGLEAQESGLGPRTNDELTGEVLHPYGKLMRTGDRENVTFNGVPLRLRSGVGAKNIVGTIRKVVAVAKQLSFTPDKAMDMVARAAAAQKDGNRKAFTVLSNLAAYEMGEAILERMADLQEQGKAEGRKEWVQLRDAWASEATLLKSYEEGKEYAQLIEQAKVDLAEAKTTEDKKAIEKAKNILDGLVDPITAYMPYDARKGIKATKRHDFDNAADRASYRSEFIATIEYKSDAEIKAEMEAREQRIERYKGYTQTDNVQQLVKMMEQEQAASQRLLDKRASGERTQKTEAIKVKEDKSVYKGLPNKEDPFEKARNDLQGRKDSAQAAADDLSARAKADEALMALADEVEQVVEEEIKAAVGKVVGKHPKAQLTKNLRRLGNALVNAAKALYQSAKDGKLNKNELIAELRKALRAFKQVVGGVARELDKLVSELVAEYQAAKVSTKQPVVEAVQFNAEGSYASGKGVSQAEFDEAKDYIAKVLGPKVITQLVKDLGGNSAAWNRKGGDAIIRIAMHAANPLSKAHHEAMHEFFQRLLDSGSPAADTLRTTANSKIVQRQIEQFFHKDANYAKIKQAVANDEHERVAYMFQLWAAGKLNLGPQTQSVFKKVVNFLRKTFGFLTADQKAEVVMQYFHDGKMSEPNLVAEVLSKDPRFQTEFQNKVLDAANPIMRAVREVTFTAQNVLIESGNKGFEKIGRLFSTETGRRNEDISFFDAKMQKTNQYNDHLFNLIRSADEKDLAAAVEGLQIGVMSKDAKIAKLQGSIHKMLEHIYQYMTDAGVKIRHQKDYFPRSWDFTKIAENRAKFEQMLIDEHLKTTGKPLGAGVATGIVNTIIENRGADPLNEDELFAGYTPFMAAANKRVLSFIKSPEFAEYQHNDLREIMTTYIAQAVHKAEYTRRFGHNGSELRKMIIEAVGEEVGAAEWGKARKAAQDKLDAERKKLEALHPKDKGKVMEELTKLGYHKGELQISQIAAEITDKEARTKFADYEPQLRQNVRAIMAMEGTLGADINPNLRKWQAGLIVYENMRLLGMSLFSQVIDPLGVLVRGGSLNDAWNTFKKGLAGTWAGWRGHPLEDSASKLAMRLGIVDAGAYMNSQGNAYSSIFLGKTAQKWNDRLFRWNGVEGFSQGTRVGAMEAAIAFIKAHSTLPTEHSERWLSELNLKASDIKLDAKGELDYSDPKIQRAIFRWVEGAILRPNASMRPSWSSDPHFALIFHLKQFTYAMQKVLLERVANEAKHGNYDPAITMILTYVPAMMAADFLRGIAAHGGEEPPWKRRWTFGDYLADGVQRAGLFGVPQLALDAAKWGPTELAGPAVEQVNRIGKTFLRDIERDIELDVKAAASGNIGDLERARDFNGVAHAAKKSLRDAMPINSLTKRYVYDEIVGK